LQYLQGYKSSGRLGNENHSSPKVVQPNHRIKMLLPLLFVLYMPIRTGYSMLIYYNAQTGTLLFPNFLICLVYSK
jgi:hypothetical protein